LVLLAAIPKCQLHQAVLLAAAWRIHSARRWRIAKDYTGQVCVSHRSVEVLAFKMFENDLVQAFFILCYCCAGRTLRLRKDENDKK
jgi:hypothetical protein